MWDAMWSYDPVTPADVAVETAESAEKTTENIKETADIASKALVAASAIFGATILGVFAISRMKK